MLLNDINSFKKELDDELIHNILPFWINRMQDMVNGGFYGCINGKGKVIKDAHKGSVLNTRILWTFSAAYRLYGNKEYLEVATRAQKYLLKNFIDKKYKGVYWQLNHTGSPSNSKKQVYAQAFAIYGLTEYWHATGDGDSLELSIEIFKVIEEYCFKHKTNGYVEALSEEWQPIEDMRLSSKDENMYYTMNTHLHILEAYTKLYSVWKDTNLKGSLRNLIEVFLDKIIDKDTNHLNLFFDENWKSSNKKISFGHDIEAAWLLNEAALMLEDKEIIERVRFKSNLIANTASDGFMSDGSMIYEYNPHTDNIDKERHWWVQAEAVTGFYQHYIQHDNEESLIKAFNCWNYIKKNLIDKDQGEWYWSILEDGTPNINDDKAGFWKCPYHNSRMCMILNNKIL
ncbi:MAG: AGE family epimerase/isomerase [Fermentimonas sp.]|nr:AGE family epimerase/isomerase [Fermentimonas sp.]